jgi:hypothetical protein
MELVKVQALPESWLTRLCLDGRREALGGLGRAVTQQIFETWFT